MPQREYEQGKTHSVTEKTDQCRERGELERRQTAAGR
jgi:hypothetical protein